MQQVSLLPLKTRTSQHQKERFFCRWRFLRLTYHLLECPSPIWLKMPLNCTSDKSLPIGRTPRKRNSLRGGPHPSFPLHATLGHYQASPTAHSHPSILECATRRGRQLAAAASFQTAIAFAATREIYMSAIATTSQLTRSIGFYQATIGKKVVMAVTGVILFGYVLGHLIGNLQIYSPDTQQINNYARFLHSHVLLLWAVRALLLASVVLHITASVQLWLLKQKARPEAYVKKDDVPASYAARTMIWSGPIIPAFVAFHVLHLTLGSALPLHTLPHADMAVLAIVITGFRNPAVAIFYIVAMALLCMHLYHGLWSMFQSLGVNHPRYTPIIKKFAAAFAWFVAIGNISIPVAVLAGVLTLQQRSAYGTRRQNPRRPHRDP